MIAKRYELSADYVDGNYSIIFKTRPPMHWDSKVLVWKFDIMSQMIITTGTIKDTRCLSIKQNQ